MSTPPTSSPQPPILRHTVSREEAPCGGLPVSAVGQDVLEGFVEAPEERLVLFPHRYLDPLVKPVLRADKCEARVRVEPGVGAQLIPERGVELVGAEIPQEIIWVFVEQEDGLGHVLS